MAMSNAVWGIDVGQCALKALKCEYDSETGDLVATAFDFIEYPKILTQPEADPDALVQEALAEFLARNDTRRDRVAISVPGQAGLARFFKPPPVDEKMIPDIVKYEAKQQIPFPLEDVIWDYQKMGGVEVDGVTLDAEVGLFAMKRDQVFRQVAPFTDAGVELETVQLAPLTIYNFVTHEILGDAVADELDPENPPESLIVVSMGTETTDLVITNGIRLWQRSIPLGGSHFTRQLSKELKLTFAKAEHLKRNARKAEDPKAVFQAMRPVFNDLVTEIQRSVGFFQSLDRQAQLGRIVILGNAAKLPGLRQYLAKNLGQDIAKVDTFKRLDGLDVTEAPSFKENQLSFATCYGLCLQTLGAAKLSTNLIPREFITARMMREKKPFAVAAVALVLLALAVNFFFIYRAWAPTDEKYKVENVDWVAAGRQVESLSGKSAGYSSRDEALKAELAHVQSMGEEVVGSGDRKLLWVELMKAINECLPREEGISHDVIRRVEDHPFKDRKEIIVMQIESEYFLELEDWFTDPVKKAYLESSKDIAATKPAEPASDTEEDLGEFQEEDTTGAAEGEDPALAGLTGPSGPGWVIQIAGLHFHNSSRKVENGWGPQYVYNTLIKNLNEKEVELPIEPPQKNKPTIETVKFTMKELGVQYPTMVYQSAIEFGFNIGNPNYINQQTGGVDGGEFGPGEAPGGPGAPGSGSQTRPRPGSTPADGEETDEGETPEQVASYEAPRFNFVVQFVWVEKPLSQRLEIRRKAEEARTQAERIAAEERKAREDQGLPPEEPTDAAPAADAPADPPPAVDAGA